MSRRRDHATNGDLLGGTLSMLILQILRQQPAHGFTIARTIERRSASVLLVEEGSLYPALHRLAARGWIASYWGLSEHNRRARYYRLTPKGRRALLQESGRWTRLVRAVHRVMRLAEE
jgi:PadR family transcriptional regulator PadR